MGMPTIVYRDLDWHRLGWERRVYKAATVPRIGDKINLDGHPFHVHDVAWCGPSDASMKEWFVYVELVNAARRGARPPWEDGAGGDP